jgi:hypothetical protein
MSIHDSHNIADHLTKKWNVVRSKAIPAGVTASHTSAPHGTPRAGEFKTDKKNEDAPVVKRRPFTFEEKSN